MVVESCVGNEYMMLRILVSWQYVMREWVAGNWGFMQLVNSKVINYVRSREKVCMSREGRLEISLIKFL